ncbi:protein translocase subunit SecD [soil metagenome]
MNRYPWWTYTIVAIILAFGVLYAVPNFFGQSPAVQVSSAKVTVRVEADMVGRIQQILDEAKLPVEAITYEATQTGGTVRARVANQDLQIQVKDALQKVLAPDPDTSSYVVALNLVSNTPVWMQKIRALPMFLGLDLRGGVYFLLKVDVDQAVNKRIDASVTDLRNQLRDKNVRHAGITRVGNTIEVAFRDDDTRDIARRTIGDNFPDLSVTSSGGDADRKLVLVQTEAATRTARENAIRQNMVTLANRVNALGVSEPVVQQQGADRIVIQLPGVQDTAEAVKILGRTATLEFRMVDESPEARAALSGGPVPFGDERYIERTGLPILLKREAILTGDSLQDAQSGINSQSHEPEVVLTVDGRGGAIIRDISRQNIGKRMALLLIEKGKGDVLTAPVIRGELGNRFNISGAMSTREAAELSLLLRAGALAAPTEIIEQRTIGPSLGADNIAKGLHSVLWGFVAILVFMSLYYAAFGVISVIALGTNVLLLVALLSLLQATLTLPGIAAIALTIGMAIDANVLINERIREELRAGRAPQQAIHEGYDRAWATILDSNVTTLIAGVALLVFGSGPVRGFAVVHCLGILTSMFSAIVVSRALVNLTYGRKRRLQKVAIGTVWSADGAPAAGSAK